MKSFSHKKALPAACLFLLIFFSPMLSYAREAFVIEHLQVDINVDENNTYHITETLDVNFSAPRHGLIRKLPLKFDKGWVNVRKIDVFQEEVFVSTEQTALNIRMGSADKYVEGKHRYVISYIYEVGADSLPDMDEFNHNVIGVEWDTQILSAAFSVYMPKPFIAEDVNCTSGRFGSTDNTSVEWRVDGRLIEGEITRPLGNYEGLTVALPLPEGYWIGAKKITRPTRAVFKLLGFPLYVFVVILSVTIWFLKGRDNKLFPTVEFYAPENMTPAEIGYVIDDSVDGKDITSLILFWAEKGHVIIEENSENEGSKIKKMTLKKVSELGPEAKSYERYVFKKLFALGEGDEVSTDDLKYQFHESIQRASHDVKMEFEGNPERAIYQPGSNGWQFLTGFLSMLPMFTLFCDLFAPVSGKGPLWILAIVLSVLFLVPTIFVSRIVSGQQTMEKKKSFLLILILLGLYGLTWFMVVNIGGFNGAQFLGAALSSIVSGFFISIVSKRTPYGDQLMEKVLGFREFIKSAEKDKIETMFEQNPSYFYSVLPYAIVMGLSDKWSRHFNKMSMSPPSWYRGYYYNDFSAYDFTRRLDSSMSHINSSMTSAPPSSGSSGSSSSGGFSGGGSGGGGGSSW